MRLTVTSALSVALLVCAYPVASTSQTVAPWEETVLAGNCADGRKLVSFEDRADSHIAKHDSLSTISPSLKTAAKLAYKCAQSTKNSYARDWYLFSFANNAFRAVTSEDEARRVWPHMISILRLLASGSTHSDVRKAATNALKYAESAESQSGIH